MKGTLFSADFVKDGNGDLRLIELNTDTSIHEDKVNDIQLADFFNVLNSNSITTLDIIYKPFIHKGIVDHISSSAATDATFLTTINLHDEDRDTIYPTSITDASNKFILRLAYDEGAVLDSSYAKNRLNVFKLFESGSQESKVVPFYHSGSDGEVNTLSYDINPTTIPDITIKDVDESFNPIDFFKLGSEVDGESVQDRWNAFVSANKAEDKLIEQYCYHSSSLDSNNKISGYRQVSIVYGSNLDTINLVSYKAPAAFSIPTDISSEVDTAAYTNKLNDHHYYEYTNSVPSKGSAGILSSHHVLLHPSGAKAINDMEVGDSVKSYFLSGSPQVESNLESMEWSIDGPNFPSGSYITSSDVVYVEKDDLKYGIMIELKVDGDSVFSGVNKQYLIYNTSSNVTKFKVAAEIDHNTDYFYDIDSNLIDIDESNYYVTSDTGLKFVELDVEDTDTYMISGSTAFNSIVSHNAPCFVAGTLIRRSLKDHDYQRVEEVGVDDVVVSFNFETGENEIKRVTKINTKQVDQTVLYTFDNGKTLQATLDHPLYCKQKGWVSSNPEYTKSKYNLDTLQVEVDDPIRKLDGSYGFVTSIEIIDEPVQVYSLVNVDDNHTYYANDFLVHNRFCFIAGTEITLSNGDVKNIEDVEAGEEVLTYGEESGANEAGKVGEVKSRTVEGSIELTFTHSTVTCTAEHPFYVNGKYVNASDLKVGDVCKTVEGETTLESIKVNEDSVEVFNLHSVGENHNFYANGILVHNKL